MTVRAIVGGLAFILLTSACGGSNEPAQSSKPSPDASTSAPETRKVSLHDSCPQVEAALPSGVVPPASRWQGFADKLTGISEAGDLETENALTGLQEAAGMLAADPANGQPYLDARQALLEALDNLATRCEAVGSSALQ